MEDIYKPITGKIISEKPSGELRWKDGILEQRWVIQEVSPNPSMSYSWRPVPTFDDKGAA